jgi:anti-sigma regulatory factor (Ser/Thr protein kinase)
MAEGLDGVVVVASELVANGLLHARTPLVLRVLAREQRMRVEVRDGSRRAPRPIEVSLQTEGGRGLLVVSRLAASWGWEFEGEGKVVWAEFDRARLRPQVSGAGQAREQFEPPGQRRAGDTHPPRGCAT